MKSRGYVRDGISFLLKSNVPLALPVTTQHSNIVPLIIEFLLLLAWQSTLIEKIKIFYIFCIVWQLVSCAQSSYPLRGYQGTVMGESGCTSPAIPPWLLHPPHSPGAERTRPNFTPHFLLVSQS